MTPLSRLFLRTMPRPLAVMALVFAYAFMLLALLATKGSGQADIIYVDVRNNAR